MKLLWIILLPLGAALLTPLVGRVLKQAVGWWATLVSAVTVGLLLSLTNTIGTGAVTTFVADWPAPVLGVRLSLFADGWGWTFALIVSGIGTLVCLYAQHYLAADEPRARFFTYLLLFEAAMLGVVLSSNLVALVVFWELTSVSSFLLIGFWHHLERARYGAYKALLITGIGGLALVAAVALIYVATGTFELRALLDDPALLREHNLFTPILVLILLGAFTKSAQFPFHLWLPDAMTAPTPVSAYLHSATMVKAGVFLLGRVHPLFRETDQWFWIVSVVGAVTMCVGAYAATRKTDLKALLAYSTISQLGLITMLYGLGTELATLAATFHIINHAAFKAGLFLVAGIVDHEAGSRDLREVGGLGRAMPWTAACAVVVALSSAGMIFFNGFLSKELFYEAALQTGQWAWPALAVGASVFTFIYSVRLFHQTFFNGALRAPKHPHEAPLGLLGPVLILAAICLGVGLWPGGLERWVLRPAVAAVWGGAFEFHIHIWHGFNLALGLSAATVALGLAGYLGLRRLLAVQERLAWPFTANTIYDGALAGLLAGTAWLTNALQNGRLRVYFWWAIVALLGGLAAVLSTAGVTTLFPAQLTKVEMSEGVLAALLIIATLTVAMLNQQRLPAVISLGAVGFLISVLYLVLSAPDLALTQLLVESVTVILFLLVLHFLPKQTPPAQSRGQRRADKLLAAAFGGAMCLLVLGVAAARAPERVADFFVASSLEKAGGRNIVNVILVDFRGFDTLGEITVLAIAALGAYALIKLRPGKRKAPEATP